MVHALTKPVLEPSTEGGGRSKKTGPQPVAAPADLEKYIPRHFDFGRKEFLKPGRCAIPEPGVNPAHPQLSGESMPDDLAQPPLGKHGGKRPGAGRPRKGETREKNQPHRVSLKSQYGNSADYICARLERDGHLRLLEGVRNLKISAYEAGVQAGYCRRPVNRGGGSDNQAKRRAWDVRALIG